MRDVVFSRRLRHRRTSLMEHQSNRSNQAGGDGVHEHSWMHSRTSFAIGLDRITSVERSGRAPNGGPMAGRQLGNSAVARCRTAPDGGADFVRAFSGRPSFTRRFLYVVTKLGLKGRPGVAL